MPRMKDMSMRGSSRDATAGFLRFRIRNNEPPITVGTISDTTATQILAECRVSLIVGYRGCGGDGFRGVCRRREEGRIGFYSERRGKRKKKKKISEEKQGRKSEGHNSIE